MQGRPLGRPVPVFMAEPLVAGQGMSLRPERFPLPFLTRDVFIFATRQQFCWRHARRQWDWLG